MAQGREATFNTYRLDALRAAIKPARLHYFPTLGSTNSHAARMRREGRLVAPAVVLTSRQTAGRGRGNNTWHSPRGVMTATLVISGHDTLPPQHVPLIAGLAVAEALESVCGIGVGVKWPNDIWQDDLKLAGLLCERLNGIDLIGVGLNVNLDRHDLPPSLRQQATSLRGLLGRPVPISDALIAVVRRVAERLRDPRITFAAIRKDYERRHVLTGRLITVRDGQSVRAGVCDGIDSSGRLLLRTGTQVERIIAGSIALRSG